VPIRSPPIVASSAYTNFCTNIMMFAVSTNFGVNISESDSIVKQTLPCLAQCPRLGYRSVFRPDNGPATNRQCRALSFVCVPATEPKPTDLNADWFSRNRASLQLQLWSQSTAQGELLSDKRDRVCVKLLAFAQKKRKPVTLAIFADLTACLPVS
jgi:hypothetical protein